MPMRAEVGAGAGALRPGRELGAGPAAERVLRRRESRWSRDYASRDAAYASRAALDRRDQRAILGVRAEDAPFKVVAVASRDAARAQAYAHEHGIAAAHGSYDELLEDPDVDAVYIALPEGAPPRVDDARARGRQARPRREAVHAASGASRRSVRRGRAPRAGPHRGRTCGGTPRQTQLLLSAAAPARRAAGNPRVVLRRSLPGADDVRFVPRARRRRAARSRLLLHAARRGSSLRRRAGTASTARRGSAAAGSTSASQGRSVSSDVTATFACGVRTRKTNTLEVIGADGVLPRAARVRRTAGVVLVKGVEHRVEPAKTTASSSPTSAPRSAASGRR